MAAFLTSVFLPFFTWMILATKLWAQSYCKIGEIFFTILFLARIATPSPLEPFGFYKVVKTAILCLDAVS